MEYVLISIITKGKIMNSINNAVSDVSRILSNHASAAIDELISSETVQGMFLDCWLTATQKQKAKEAGSQARKATSSASDFDSDRLAASYWAIKFILEWIDQRVGKQTLAKLKEDAKSAGIYDFDEFLNGLKKTDTQAKEKEAEKESAIQATNQGDKVSQARARSVFTVELKEKELASQLKAKPTMGERILQQEVDAWNSLNNDYIGKAKVALRNGKTLELFSPAFLNDKNDNTPTVFLSDNNGGIFLCDLDSILEVSI